MSSARPMAARILQFVPVTRKIYALVKQEEGDSEVLYLEARPVISLALVDGKFSVGLTPIYLCSFGDIEVVDPAEDIGFLGCFEEGDVRAVLYMLNENDIGLDKLSDILVSDLCRAGINLPRLQAEKAREDRLAEAALKYKAETK